MDFAEEKTPSGFILKVMFTKYKFLVFDRRGNSVYPDKEGRSLLHKIPTIIFIGTLFNIERDYDREYTLLKITNDNIILPYRDIVEKKRKYLFIPTDEPIDMIPSIIILVRSYSAMLKDIAANTDVDYLIFDDSISETELSVIVSRYKPGKVINIRKYSRKSEEHSAEKEIEYININTLSDNPVFLARMHLKNMALSNLNQLLLDFDISALDTQYIIYFIKDILSINADLPEVRKNVSMLQDLQNSFEFYLALIQRNSEMITDKIKNQSDYKKLPPYRTLISKVRASHPGKEEQLLYTEFENMVLERSEELAAT